MHLLTKVVLTEVATTVIGNALWSMYKNYCKWCWKTFYKRELTSNKK